MSMPFSRAIRAIALVLGAAMRLSGQESPVNTAPVNLPEFNVVGEHELPPPESWRYSRLGPHEVLSSAPRGTTERALKDLNRLLHGLSLLNTPLLPPSDHSAKIMICGRDADIEIFAKKHGDKNSDEDVRTWHYEYFGRDGAVLVLDQTARSLDLFDNLDNQTDEESTDVSLDQQRASNFTRRLQVAVVKFLLYQQNPDQPAWLAEGLAQTLASVRITENSVTLGVVENPQEVLAGVDERATGHTTPAQMLTRQRTPARDSLQEDLDFNAALASSALMPLAELFSWQRDTYIGQGVTALRWSKQCHAFVHWGLFGDVGLHRKQFLVFMQRALREPVSEALFREHFGLDYAQGLAALRTHVENVRAKVIGVAAEKGARLPEPLPIEVRDATQREVARLKFITYTLAGLPDRAHTELVHAYRRGDHSPDLVAELGASALQLGQRDRAQTYLEAAIKAKSTRTRAYLVLARLRLEDRLTKPQGKAGKLSYEQLLGVLEPLILARAQAPRTPALYTLFAEAWAQADLAPPPQHLALIDEGLRSFPQDTALREARARLGGPSATAP